MKMKITVAEALELIDEIRKRPGNLFEMIRADVKQSLTVPERLSHLTAF